MSKSLTPKSTPSGSAASKSLTLSEMAARWYLRMREHAQNQRSAEHHAFEQWLADDPSHAAEYDSFAHAMRQLDSAEGLSTLADAAEQQAFFGQRSTPQSQTAALGTIDGRLLYVCGRLFLAPAIPGLAGRASHAAGRAKPGRPNRHQNTG